MAATNPLQYEMDERRGYARVQDAVGLHIVRLHHLPAAGDSPDAHQDDKSPSLPESPTHTVSLSASGLAFADDALYYPGEPIDVTLCLFPGGQAVNFDARIVSAGEAPEIADGEKHTYRLVYIRISDSDRALLDAHVLALQKSMPRQID